MGKNGRASGNEKLGERILAALRAGSTTPDDLAAATGLAEQELIAEVGWLVFVGLVRTDRTAPRDPWSRFPFGVLTLTTAGARRAA